ncbi:uncharacterized protein PSANT_01750 [Moesziomyces antarcticus]|uniref:Uncharacterized protein n=1 Tax=Pseudozyma antarctica TaxID=84753 RepID=A0A5C3FJW3_PSEA2|nr:uncharacterized protein PSANT_01750 [Moesziomyces antarcticus]
MVATYCNHQGNIPAGLYACFRLNGDIRKRMQSADDTVKGFVNAAGNMFVVVYSPDTKAEEFHTDKMGVFIKKADTSPCLVVNTQQGGDNGSVDHNACNADPAVWLAD